MVKKFKKIGHFLLALFAYWYYGRPARKLIVVGVTGTKGKSTTCRYIASVLEAGGNKVGMLTTVEFQIGDRRWANDKKMTMLGRGQIQRMLKEMVNEGCRYVVIETSSEGILQYRHYGLKYDIAVFTNLGTEHSERHGGYHNLRSDKGKMFAALTAGKNKNIDGHLVQKIIVVNADDKESEFFSSFKADKKIAFSFGKNTSLPIETEVAVKSEQGIFFVGREQYSAKIVGDYNMYNALAAVVVGKALGISYDHIKRGIESVTLVPGRMEFIEEGQPYRVVVDYAHEPMSLEALFSTLREIVKKGRIISVIGSDGGGRDKQKRSAMGEISGKLTDMVFVTDVNCFDEDPVQIAEMLAVGARKAGKQDNLDLFVEVDRRQAIKKAFMKASPGDVVAITAKGTEPYICVANGVKIPWDDRQVARELIKEIYVAQFKAAAEN